MYKYLKFPSCLSGSLLMPSGRILSLCGNFFFDARMRGIMSSRPLNHKYFLPLLLENNPLLQRHSINPSIHDSTRCQSHL